MGERKKQPGGETKGEKKNSGRWKNKEEEARGRKKNNG